MQKISNENLLRVEEELFDLKSNLSNHTLYRNINCLDDVRVFMESHVFAVWDFMSLLKGLQKLLTNVQSPWIPMSNNSTRRFINEIVLDEESDIDVNGHVKSHFEMYLDSMSEVGANKIPIESLIKKIRKGIPISLAIKELEVHQSIKTFLKFTFEVIETNKPHIIASAFTFGREDVIPDMFVEIIEKSCIESNQLSSLLYYFKRHIELDGDEHGPMSLNMVAELCGDDLFKWEESINIAKEAISKRITLWDSINDTILSNKQNLENFRIINLN